MKKALLLFTEISDKGGIEVFSKYFLDFVIKCVKNTNLNIVLVNNKKPPKIKNYYKKINFLCCGSQYKLIRKIKFAFFFLKILIFEKPNYIISNHISLLRLLYYFRKIFKINYGFIGYGIEVWDLDNINKEIVRNAKVIATFSDYTATKIKEQINSKYTYILFPPLIKENKFFIKPKNKKLIKKYKLEGKKIILTVARLASTEKYKGYDKVIKALPKIIKKVPNIKYLIVGEGDDLLRLKNLVKNLDLEDYIIFCGFIPNKNLVDYYNLCDVFVMPSKGEGFGIVFLEALACGKPVIAGNKDGSCDALLNGKLGVLIDPDNIKEIENAIIMVLNKEISKELLDSNYLRKKVIEVYGTNKFKERTRKFIKMVEYGL